MKQLQEKVLHYLTGAESFESVALDDLQRIAEEHPYFPVTQFLWTKKLQVENSPEFIAQAQKAANYFHNPYWLDYQLNTPHFPEIVFEDNDIVEVGKKEEDTHVIESEGANATIISTDNDKHPVTTVFSLNEINAASELAHETLTDTHTAEDIYTDRNKADQENSIVDIEKREDLTPIESEDEFVNEDELRDRIEQVVPPLETSLDEVIVLPGEISDIDRNEKEEPLNLSDDKLTTNIGNAPDLKLVEPENGAEVQQPVAEKPVIFQEVAAPLVSQKTIDNTTKTGEIADSRVESTSHRDRPSPILPLSRSLNSEPDEHERMFLNIKAMLDASAEEAEADATDAPIPIDPYYTIDYFASQGIKLELDQNPRDQLGQNLKKFTQWLKHMKKLGPEDATEVINKTETDSDIQKIADSSNTVREVVTEAMAQVLEKQGKKEKAIELYNKLSFLNPDKSVYFADKIKKLKGY